MNKSWFGGLGGSKGGLGEGLGAIWAARDLGRLGGRSIAPSLLSTAMDSEVIRKGSDDFSSGKRKEPRLR